MTRANPLSIDHGGRSGFVLGARHGVWPLLCRERRNVVRGHARHMRPEPPRHNSSSRNAGKPERDVALPAHGDRLPWRDAPHSLDCFGSLQRLRMAFQGSAEQAPYMSATPWQRNWRNTYGPASPGRWLARHARLPPTPDAPHGQGLSRSDNAAKLRDDIAPPACDDLQQICDALLPNALRA